VQPLELPRQERQLVLSKHVELLIWHRLKEDKENILVDGLVLAFPVEPPTRARL
jgi:hypothetical protein